MDIILSALAKRSIRNRTNKVIAKIIRMVSRTLPPVMWLNFCVRILFYFNFLFFIISKDTLNIRFQYTTESCTKINIIVEVLCFNPVAMRIIVIVLKVFVEYFKSRPLINRPTLFVIFSSKKPLRTTAFSLPFG